MYSEAYRPTVLTEVIGHADAKVQLKEYLTSQTFERAILLTGSPGIGKTTMALAAARTYGFDPLEINASKSIRSYEDVERIKNACRSAVNIHSFLRGDTTSKTCVVLDEIDGSDPHAQNKVIEWVKDSTRKVPILFTSNEVPTIFKRNSNIVDIIRCFPPKPSDLEKLFPNQNIENLTKECQYDIRKMFHRIQYGVSDTIPKYIFPPTGLPVEMTFVLKQLAFGLMDPLDEYHAGIPDNERSYRTNLQYKIDEKRDHTAEPLQPRKKSHPDK